jgi:hypothetical protein
MRGQTVDVRPDGNGAGIRGPHSVAAPFRTADAEHGAAPSIRCIVPRGGRLGRISSIVNTTCFVGVLHAAKTLSIDPVEVALRLRTALVVPVTGPVVLFMRRSLICLRLRLVLPNDPAPVGRTASTVLTVGDGPRTLAMSAVGTDEGPPSAEHNASRRHSPNGGAKRTRGSIGHIQRTTTTARWSHSRPGIAGFLGACV